MKTLWPCPHPLILLKIILLLYKTGESLLDISIRQYIIQTVLHSTADIIVTNYQSQHANTANNAFNLTNCLHLNVSNANGEDNLTNVHRHDLNKTNESRYISNSNGVFNLTNADMHADSKTNDSRHVNKADGEFNFTNCQSRSASKRMEMDLQSAAGLYLMLYRIIVNVPSIFVGLCCGSWSDKNGRKLPMVLPSLGSALAVIFYLLSISFAPLQMIFVFIGALVQGSFGKSSAITMAVTSYASDMTNTEARSAELGMVVGVNFLGLFLGALLSGVMHYLGGYNIILYACLAIHITSATINVLFLPETILPSANSAETSSSSSEESDKDSENAPNVEKRNACRRLWDQMTEPFSVLTKIHENKTHIVIWMLFLMALINQTCKVGEFDVTLLFVTRRPFLWDASQYSFLVAIDYAVMSFTTIVIVPTLSRVCRLSDILLLCVGVSCKVVRLIWSGFMDESWMVYTTVVIGAIAGMIPSSIRSLLSKAVNEDECGKIFSLLASAETASKLTGTIIFVNIYRETASFLPGFAFLSEALFYIVILSMIGVLRQLMRYVGSAEEYKKLESCNTYGTNNGTRDRSLIKSEEDSDKK